MQGTGQDLPRSLVHHQQHGCLECHQPTLPFIHLSQMPLIPHELEQVGYFISVKDCKTLMFNISSLIVFDRFVSQPNSPYCLCAVKYLRS